jgi:hypothetical protein
MGCAVCKIVGNLEVYIGDEEIAGIVSASLSASTDIYKTPDDVVLIGPTTGTLSLVAYPYIAIDGKPTYISPFGDRLLGTPCRGRASVQVEWVRRYDCDTNRLYFIPKKGGRSFIEGEFPPEVLELVDDIGGIISYKTFSADASQGPHRHYLLTDHTDGFGLRYNARPISFDSSSPVDVEVDIRLQERGGNGDSFVIPEGARLYLSSFEITVEPPLTSRVTYNFIFYFVPEGWQCP